MILTLRIECVFGIYLKKQCVRVIEMDEDSCLYHLHDAVQNAVNFGRDHPFEFYLANSSSPFAHRHWLTEKEAWEDKEDDFYRITLKDLYPLGRKKLYYLFDFGDQWTFEVRKMRGSKAPVAGVKYPRLIESVGPDPEQYPRVKD